MLVLNSFYFFKRKIAIHEFPKPGVISVGTQASAVANLVHLHHTALCKVSGSHWRSAPPLHILVLQEQITGWPRAGQTFGDENQGHFRL